MKSELKFYNFLLVAIFFKSACGSRLQFLPLTANQVYRTLRDAGREDAIPEGRFVTQGIAAVAGFAAGMATGIGVPLFLNIDLANVTGILGNRNSGASTAVQTQEICFTSRSLNEIEDISSHHNQLGKRNRIIRKGDNTNKNNIDYAMTTSAEGTTNDNEQEARTFPSVSPSSLSVNSPTATTSQISDTQTPPTATDTNTGTLGTDTQMTTQTGGSGSVNCIVV